MSWGGIGARRTLLYTILEHDTHCEYTIEYKNRVTENMISKEGIHIVTAHAVA